MVENLPGIKCRLYGGCSKQSCSELERIYEEVTEVWRKYSMKNLIVFVLLGRLINNGDIATEWCLINKSESIYRGRDKELLGECITNVGRETLTNVKCF
jgi:hypothetical protein